MPDTFENRFFRIIFWYFLPTYVSTRRSIRRGVPQRRVVTTYTSGIDPVFCFQESSTLESQKVYIRIIVLELYYHVYRNYAKLKQMRHDEQYIYCYFFMPQNSTTIYFGFSILSTTFEKSCAGSTKIIFCSLLLVSVEHTSGKIAGVQGTCFQHYQSTLENCWNIIPMVFFIRHSFVLYIYHPYTYVL